MDLPKLGYFSWNELVTPDEDASFDFYQQLFGWQSVPFCNPNNPNLPGGKPYKLLKADDDPMRMAGGMIQCPMPKGCSQWVPYVVVADTDAAVAAAKKLGAELILEPTDIPNVGRIAVFKDPQGATIGVHQLAQQGC